MKCHDVRQMISRGLDGELDDESARAVEVHCAACALCRRFREIAIAGLSAHRAAHEVEPPAFLLARILSAVEPAPRPSRLGGLLKYALPAAAVVSAAAGIWIGGLMHERFTPPEGAADADLLGLTYLEEYPPNSFGDILTESSNGGGGYER